MDDNNNLNASQQLNISQISFTDFDNSLFASTPSKKKRAAPAPKKPANVKRARTVQKEKPTFAVPSTYLFKCNICPKKEYKTARYYNQHMMMHKVKGKL